MKGELKIDEDLSHLNSKRKITFWNTWPPVASERAVYIMTHYPGMLGKAIREMRDKMKSIKNTSI